MKQPIFYTAALVWHAGNANFPFSETRNLYKRLRFWRQALAHLPSIHRWLSQDASPALQTELKRSLLLLKVLTNPYINTRWCLQERAQAISAHYQLISELQREPLNFADSHYWNCVGFTLAEQAFRIVVDRPRWMRSEGEMTISLFMGIDRLYSIAYSLAGSKAAPRLLLGAIQGAGSMAADKQYAELTKVFHGARPRDLMVQVAKMLACNLGCSEVWGISDACHQSIGRGNAFARASKYDAIWMENGGIPNDSGFFVMSSQLQKRLDEDVPARKRALYRRRYALLDHLQASMQAAFAKGQVETLRHGE